MNYKIKTLYIFKCNSLCSFHMIYEPDLYIIEKNYSNLWSVDQESQEL